MKAFLLVGVYLLFAVVDLPANRSSEKIVNIPLGEIWAYNMPNTKKIGELDAVKAEGGVTKHPLVNEIVKALSLRRSLKGDSAGPSFVVSGIQKEALRNAHAVFTRAVKPATTFPSANDLTLVFYTTLGGPYTHIDSVNRVGHSINVKYRLVSHNTREDSLHFALIPLGNLESGTYEVRIESLELFDETGARKEPGSKLKGIVCSDSTFDVTKGKP